MNNIRTVFRIWPALICAGLPMGFALAQGPLAPPAGAPAALMKTLDQLEPRIPVNSTNTPGDATATFKITEAGSYYLEGPLDGHAGKHGILISASEVSIDLQGYRVRGFQLGLNAIAVDSSISNLSVENGVITGWTGDGIGHVNANTIGPNKSVVRSVRINWVDRNGIALGSQGIVMDCTVTRSGKEVGEAAIYVRDNSLVKNCVVEDGYDGIVAHQRACSVIDCKADGMDSIGISASSYSMVRGCSATTSSTGFSMGDDCQALDCLASYNSGTGFLLDGKSITLNRCVSLENTTADGHGFAVNTINNHIQYAGLSFADCSADENAGSGFVITDAAGLTNCKARKNSAYGFRAVELFGDLAGTYGDDCTFENCSADSNGSGGFLMIDNNSFTQCSATNNTGHGWELQDRNALSECLAQKNTQKGFHLNKRNHAQECSAVFNDEDGLSCTEGNKIFDGIFSNNGFDGLEGTYDCFILNNICEQNGRLTTTGAGVLALAGSRMEGNTVIENDIGIKAPGGLVIKNSANLNTTNYDMSLADHGPVVDLSGSMGAMNVPNSDHPWANFIY